MVPTAVTARPLSPEPVLAELPGPAGRTAYRELRLSTLWRVVRQARQRRPDQRTMDRTVTVAVVGDRSNRRHFDGLFRNAGFRFGFDQERRVVGTVRGGIETGRDDFTGHAGQYLLVERAGQFFLAALGWHLCVLELVLAVAGGASGLAHFVADHGDDGVVRDSALARTVVIDYVAETRLALLHQAP